MLYIAHRGDHALHEENSFEAILKAIHDPYWDGVEFDIRFTKDFKCIIFHDDNLMRLCNIDKNILDLRLDELNSIKFKNYPDDHIPTLEDMLEAVKHTNKKILIEIKGSINQKHKIKLHSILSKFKELDIEIISFDLKNKLDDYPFCFLSSKLKDLDLKTLYKNSVDHVNIDYQNHSIKEIKAIIEKGFKVSIWTNDLDDLPYQQLNIQFFTSNKIKRSAL